MKRIGKTTKAYFFKKLDEKMLDLDKNETKDRINLDVSKSFKELCEFIESVFYFTTLKYTYSSTKDFYRMAISNKYGVSGLSHQVNGRLSVRFFPKSAQISVRINFNKKYLPILKLSALSSMVVKIVVM